MDNKIPQQRSPEMQKVSDVWKKKIGDNKKLEGKMTTSTGEEVRVEPKQTPPPLPPKPKVQLKTPKGIKNRNVTNLKDSKPPTLSLKPKHLSVTSTKTETVAKFNEQQEKVLNQFKADIKQVMLGLPGDKNLDLFDQLDKMKEAFQKAGQKAKGNNAKALGEGIMQLFNSDPAQVEKGLLQIAENKGGLQDLLLAIGGNPETAKQVSEAVSEMLDDGKDKNVLGKVGEVIGPLEKILPPSNRSKTLDKIFKGLGESLSKLMGWKYEGLGEAQIQEKYRATGKIIAIVIVVVAAIIAIAAAAGAPYILPLVSGVAAVAAAYQKATGFVDQFADSEAPAPLKIEIVNPNQQPPKPEEVKFTVKEIQNSLVEMLKLAEEVQKRRNEGEKPV